MQIKLPLVLAVALGLSVSVAKADLIIDPNGGFSGKQATPEANGNFPCTTCATPVTTFGYTDPAILKVGTAGNYTFTYEGAGDATQSNTFFTVGGHTFANMGLTPNVVGDTFTVFLPAGAIDFSFSSTGSAGNCSISNGVGPSGGECSYLIALDDSLTAPGATGPQSTAWIGFADINEPAGSASADYQDLVVHVTENVPEPASLALLGSALFGFGAFRRRRKVS